MKDGIEMNNITGEFSYVVKPTPYKSSTLLVNMTLWNQIHNKIEHLEKLVAAQSLLLNKSRSKTNFSQVGWKLERERLIKLKDKNEI